jgi:Tol biopolymer transport system component
MAHYSYLSPDQRSLLIVEMDRTVVFQSCRLTPFDGSGPGKQVGPHGICTAAGWSPDGRWMYFTVEINGASHVWRQRFPDGMPEQLTFGPTEEDGISVAADGRSLVTAVGQRRSTIWIHDDKGERQVSAEGFVFRPRLSSDGQRLYYLRQQNSSNSSSVELRSTELASGRTDLVVPDRSMADYDISKDQRDVVFVAAASDGVPEIWLATVDRSAPPRRLVRGGDELRLTQSGVFYRELGTKESFLTRIGRNETEPRRVMQTPILDVVSLSPSGSWALVIASGTGEVGTPALFVVDVQSGTSKLFCAGCNAYWGPDGKWLYIITPRGRTIALPWSNEAFPDSLRDILDGAAKGTLPPGAQFIDHAPIAPGPNPSIYVFTKQDIQRNLYRIPLH